MDKFVRNSLNLFANYFLEIDFLLSTRLLRPIPPYETTLTDELLAYLDRTSRDREAYGAAKELQDKLNKFREEFTVPPQMLNMPDVDFDVLAFDHSRGFESQVSNVDIGLLIEFGARGSDTYQRKIYLLQAKKLGHYKNENSEKKFGMKSKFRSMRAEQHAAMRYYETKLNVDIFRYMYYMPLRNLIDPDSQFRSNASGLFGRINRCGIWIGRVTDNMAVNPQAIYQAQGIDTVPLMAVILGHIAQSMGETSLSEKLIGRAGTEMGYPSEHAEDDDLALALVSGDKAKIEAVQDRLSIGPVAYAPVPNTVLRIRLPPVPTPRPVIAPSTGFQFGG